MKKELQTRNFKTDQLQIRELEDGKRVITGLIPFNQRSEFMGFYEYIAPTAFNKTVNDGADVRALWNHDDSMLLGRVKNGSLRLMVQEDGLHVECDLPKTSYAEDVYELIRGGYNTGMSFGFYTIQDEWKTEEVDGQLVDVCTLLEVRLLEVSFAVSFPAYEGTESKARSVRSLIDSLKKLDFSKLSDEEKKELEDTLREFMPEEGEPEPSEEAAAAESTALTDEQESQLDEFLANLE